MITHHNMIAVVSAISLVLVCVQLYCRTLQGNVCCNEYMVTRVIACVMQKEVALGPQDVLLSFLPLAHIYEQMTEVSMLL